MAQPLTRTTLLLNQLRSLIGVDKFVLLLACLMLSATPTRSVKTADTGTAANNSAFQFIFPHAKPDTQDILLGGYGNISRFSGGKIQNDEEIPRGFEITFDDADPNPATRAKRYLLRLINTAFDNTFVFSIDNHKLIVVEADFVPVENFTVTSIPIAIGQRYNVIVEAAPVVNSSYPSSNPLPKDGNF